MTPPDHTHPTDPRRPASTPPGRSDDTHVYVVDTRGAVPRSAAPRVAAPPGEPATAAQPPRTPRLGLTLHQVIGTSLAAGTVALLTSTLGIAGTLIGAVVGSVVATIGSAVYADSLRRAGRHLGRVKTLATSSSSTAGDSAATSSSPASPAGSPLQSASAPVSRGTTTAPNFAPGSGEPARAPRRLRPLHVLVGILVGAAIAIGGITVVEMVLGHPLGSSTTTGTSVGSVVSRPDPGARPTPTVPATPRPSATHAAKPTPTPSAIPSSTPSPSPAPTPSTSPSASPSPTPTPAASTHP